MANVYNAIYEGEFCNSSGDNIQVVFSRRMSDASPIPIPIDIIFAGENESPLTVNYKDDGDYKLSPVNGSEAVIKIKAIDDFELSSMFTADEREWMVEINGARIWRGFIIPDSCSEPFMSKPYDVTIRATDALGTLKDIPFQNADGTKYSGHYRDREVLRLALEKTGLSMDLLIAVNTFEVNMNDTLDTGALGQSYINVARFLDADLVPFSCYDVIASILRRWSSRLHQHGGKWQVVNVLEQSAGSVSAKSYDRSSGGFNGNSTLGNLITAGGQDRFIRPIGSSQLAKGFLASTAYYQFGLISNQLINGDFNDYDPLVAPLPNHWLADGTTNAATGVRIAPDGNPTADYYLIIYPAGPGGMNSYIYNDTPVQVRAGETTTVSFELLVPDAFSPVAADRIIEVRLKDNFGKYMTNTGWGTATKWYEIRFHANQFRNIINVSFTLQKQSTDYTVEIGLFAAWEVGTLDRFETNINNVNISSSSSDSATQPPIGTIFREEQFAPQTYTQDAILMLHSDDSSPSRTSPIMIYADDSAVTLPTGMGVNSQFWARNAYVAENLSLQNIVADSELIMHSRPYRILDFEFVPTGFEEIDINTLLTVDLLDGDFIFLSGEFDWKKDIHRLRFAEVLTADVDNFTTLKEDYGKDKAGSLVSSPSGVSGGGSGGTFIDLSNYALLTDLPIKADDTETQTGANDVKFVTPLKLKNWWTFIKTQAATISGLWDFTTRPTFNSVDLITMPDIGTGWAVYTDTAHTSGSPLVINSGVTSTITNNGATVINSNIPDGVTSWYDSGTSKIMPSLVGDSYSLNIRFTAVSSSNTGLADVLLDVTGLGVIDAQTISLRKGAGSSQRINVVFDVYSLITFVTNGGIIKLNSLDGNTSIYDITYKITRVHKAI